MTTALAQRGVRHFVVSSGSRCAPLVLAVAKLRGVHVWPHPDERAAGFFALGIGKASRIPAALICTSGTAAAHYYPAIIEARLSGTPLVILSADRPPRLRGVGAPQTIDQIDMYAGYPLYFRDLPLPQPDDENGTVWEQAAARAYAISLGPPAGPVHLNVPFDEPLIPPPDAAAAVLAEDRSQATASILTDGDPPPHDDNLLPDIVRVVAGRKRRLIICGPQNDADDLADAIMPLAHALGAPVLADVASQVRFPSQGRVISHFDLLLRDAQFARATLPEAAIRFGGLPTSKALNEWLAADRLLEYVAIERRSDLTDPYGSVTHRLRGDLVTMAGLLRSEFGASPPCDSAYHDLWQAADRSAAASLDERRHERMTDGVYEGDFIAAAFRLVPDETAVYLSNSMPIRHADSLAQGRAARLRVLCNRGANGIDGLISSAAGASAALGRPVILLVGDVAFMYDLNGLWLAARERLPLKIILLNNSGGGIFSFLPVSEHTHLFERLVAMPHGLNFADAARLYQIPHQRVSTLDAFESLVVSSLARPGPDIIEVMTDRRHLVAAHGEICRRVAMRVREEILSHM